MALRKFVEHPGNLCSIVSTRLEFALQFLPGMLATRKRRERIGLRVPALLPTQASASDSLSEGML
jgi:hypothetical protein